MDCQEGKQGSRGITPKLGLKPTIPQNPAGMRIEPPPSPPSEKTPSPAATATAAPPDEPPQVRPISQGFEVKPYISECVTPVRLNSGQVVLAMMMASSCSSNSIARQVSVGIKSLRT